MGKTIKESITAAFPLVSVVIINWNYGKYIGRTVDSVKQQDYQNLEVLVVDNGSTDDSQETIEKHIAGDERFRLIRISKNLGQLGAFFDIYKQISGEFVVNLDADDTLFRNFISTHVQVHLALGEDIALTSSDVVIINKDDEIVLHGYRGRSREKPESVGLGSLGSIARLKQIDDEAYKQLSEKISIYHGPVGWIWGPGSSNMYRHGVLDLIYEHPKRREWMRSSDNFLNPLSHALVGTALIDQELSAYRVHGTNYYTTMQIAGGGFNPREARQRQLQDFYETAGYLLRRAKYYSPILGDRYWDALRCLTKFIAPPVGKVMPGSPATIALIKENYDLLCEAFTEPVVQQHLPDFFIMGDLYQATSRPGEGSRARWGNIGLRTT